MTQVLTGHGCFGSHLHRIGKRADDRCFFCEDNDSPEHMLFYCPGWTNIRTACEGKLGRQITADNMISIMVASESNWKVIHQALVEIMEAKLQEEKRRG